MVDCLSTHRGSSPRSVAIWPLSSVGRATDCFIRLILISIMDSKMKGNITELEVLTYATKHGIQVSIPFGDRERYDQIWDIDKTLYRIQVKTSRMADNNSYIIFSCRSNTKIHGKIQHSRYSKDEIDYFATYWDNKCYLVPVEECSTEKKLRFGSPKNGQIKGVSFAKDYEMEEVLKRLK